MVCCVRMMSWFRPLYYAQFTPPTRTRQDCLVLSCPYRRTRCELNWNERTNGVYLAMNKRVDNGRVPVEAEAHQRWPPNKTVEIDACFVFLQFCPVSKCKTRQNCPVLNILRTTENCLDLSPIQFIPPTRTRQLTVSAVWTRHYSDHSVLGRSTAIHIQYHVTRHDVFIASRYVITIFIPGVAYRPPTVFRLR